MSFHEDFEEHKNSVIGQITKKTKELILKHGFVYDGKTFNLDNDSHIKWLSLKVMESEITWPYDIPSRSGAYALALANLSAFLSSCLTAINNYEDSGQVLQQLAEAATMPSELIVVVDDRT